MEPPPGPDPDWGTHFRCCLCREVAGRGAGRAASGDGRAVSDDAGSPHSEPFAAQGQQPTPDQVRLLLCEKANLLAQVRPPAYPVIFPETFKGNSAQLPEFFYPSGLLHELFRGQVFE